MFGRHLNKSAAPPRCDALRYQIFDDLNVQAHNIIESELDEIAAIDFARHLTNLKVVYASVAVEPRIIALIQHFIRINAHPERLRRCASVQAARQWIAAVCP